jgi:hypothetical protein
VTARDPGRTPARDPPGTADKEEALDLRENAGDVLLSASVLRTITVGLGLVILTGAVAHANPAGVVPTAAYPGVGEQVYVGLDYEYDADNASITREQVGDPKADPNAPLPKHRELTFEQTRYLLTPRIELGLYHNFWVSFGMPIVIRQSSQLALASGLDRASSTTFADGILTGAGFDARDPSTSPPGSLAFRSVIRSGIPELRGGFGLAPMNQALDPTKPTWKLGVEGRFAVGRVMRFDAVDPGKETGVSTGVHELRLWTSVDRRFRHVEGWFEAFWQVPVSTRKTSLFQDPGFGSTNTDLGQTAGTSFGLETNLVNDAETGNRVSLDLGTRIVAHFEGRGYTEMWEVFALAGDRRGTGPLILDSDPTAPGIQAMSYPGISTFENYLETAARIALRAKLGSHVSFAALGEVVWKTDHVITFADIGVDRPDDANDLVDPGTSEVNPLHVNKIDLVGHRYHVEDSRGYVLGVEAQVQF